MALVVRKKIKIGANQLEYVVFNNEASNTMLCFHGFGQEGLDFKELANKNPTFKIIAVDLFFHKNSYLQTINPIKSSEWRPYLDKLFENELVDQFTLMGYSMGGRFALATLQLFPNQVEAIYLLAPDGLVEGRWFRIATGSRIQRFVFRKSLNSYNTFIWLANNLSRFGILNKGLLKFAQMHMKNREERDRVYKTWCCFRKLKLSPKKLVSTILENKIPTTIILGIYDRVIPVKRIKPKLSVNEFVVIREVPITHNKLFYYNFLDAG